MSMKRSMQKDLITPHKLAIAILIREFWNTRELAKLQHGAQRNTKIYIRDFCLLILKLIQSPDLECQELLDFLYSGQYEIDSSLLKEFELTLKVIPKHSPEFFLDIIKSIATLTQPEDGPSFTIGIHSVTGCYLKRLVLAFDKLNFAEVMSFFEAFKKYIGSNDDLCKSGNSSKREWSTEKKIWSQRQAELFIVTQAALITNNESKALHPKVLHKEIQNLLKSRPHLSEAHYLSYLNYLRVKEYCGAVDSLYHSFDKKALIDSKAGNEDRPKTYRYAVLNLAVLHFQFGHKEEALMALKEAIRMAQEASDDVCLQHALSWLYCLTHNRRFIEHSIIKSLDLSLSYIMSLGIQSFVQFAGLRGGDPKKIFDTVTRSDVINCQHTHHDLISTSYSQKSSLWIFYGKTHMASLWSQLLLNLSTENLPITKTFMGEGYCQVLCNVANHLILEGDYEHANAILNFTQMKFPNEPIAQHWKLCQCYMEYTLNMHQRNFIEAEAAVQKMAVLDQYESILCMADIEIQRENFDAAKKCLQVILNKLNSDLRIDYDIRARILYTQLQVASNYPSSTPNGVLSWLNAALAYTNDYHLHYLNTLIHLHIAHIQLLMCMPQHAIKTLNSNLPQILANGYAYDRGRGLLLYAKCLVATSDHKAANERQQIIQDSANMLEKVKSYFQQVKAFHRIKDVLYLQAILYNEIGLSIERNKCAKEYRMLNDEYPTKNKYSVLIDL